MGSRGSVPNHKHIVIASFFLGGGVELLKNAEKGITGNECLTTSN